MALTYGQRWAMYLLLMQHDGDTPDSKSQFRTDVETDYNTMSYHDAVVKEAKSQISSTIQDGDIGTDIPSLGASDLRTALGLNDGYFYIPGSNPCPDTATVNGNPFDHQKAIVTALLGMPDPA